MQFGAMQTNTKKPVGIIMYKREDDCARLKERHEGGEEH
jgi:hypothetical protein